jgi:hypothetical protein
MAFITISIGRSRQTAEYRLSCDLKIWTGAVARRASTPWNLSPKENLWDEIRGKNSKNYALKAIDAVRAKLDEAISNAIPKPLLSG